MTCRDFQLKWDEMLDADARTSASPSGEPGEEALLVHAAGCPDCRHLAARYHVLRLATCAWKRPPVPPAGLVDRILAAAEVSTTSAWPVYADVERARPWKLRVALGSSVAAAAVLAAILLPRLSMMIRRAHDVGPANPPAITALSTEPDLHAVSRSNHASGERSALNRALAEASSATWDLALSASKPAARISREVLDATTHPDEVLTGSRREGHRTIAEDSGMAAVYLTVPVPSLALLAPDPSAASTAIQQVGDHVAAGVRPLSDTARHAFGFLIGPAPDQAAPRNRPPSAKGA